MDFGSQQRINSFYDGVYACIDGFCRICKGWFSCEPDVNRPNKGGCILGPESGIRIGRQAMDRRHLAQRLADDRLSRTNVQAEHSSTVYDEWQYAGSDETCDEERRYRIESRPTVKLDQKSRYDDTNGSQCVRHDMQEDTAHIVAVTLVSMIVRVIVAIWSMMGMVLIEMSIMAEIIGRCYGGCVGGCRTDR